MKARFIEAIKRTGTIKSFRFTCREKVDFLPGQFTRIIFDEEKNANRDLNKYLSFSCAPGKGYIEVTKRLSESEFSKRLDGLRKGDEVSFSAPMGNCVFREDNGKIAFLIGGIGITPVISIIEYIVEKKINTDICLLYSNRSIEDIAFKKELDAWQGQCPNLRIVYILSKGQEIDAHYKVGHIDKDMVMNYMPDAKEHTIFIFGPPVMVKAMQNICLEASACNKDMVKIENFIGY
ncbi:ferredoxin--NADP reductase [Candidatus Omnitrophota bacterium]